MTEAPLVLGLDIATYKTGVAHGRVGERPTCYTWRLASDGAPRPERNAALLRRLNDLLKTIKPDLAVIEAPLNLQAAARRSADSALALIGAALIAEMVCDMRGVPRIRMADVQDVRQHFIGHRRLPESYDPRLKRKVSGSENAKAATVNIARLRGWTVEDDNAADAAACWSFGCASVDKRLAALAAPLFARAS